jgi:hypothetical protein
MELEIIAQRGTFLLLRHDADYGRVFDLRTERLFPPTPVVSVLARGYWEPFLGDEQQVAEALTRSHDQTLEQAGQRQLPIARAVQEA